MSVPSCSSPEGLLPFLMFRNSFLACPIVSLFLPLLKKFGLDFMFENFRPTI
jgi:hypothetical protein